MTIRALRARAVDIPLARPIETALATISTSSVVLIDLSTGDGVTGWRRAVSMAERASLPVSSHRYPEVSASLLAATPTAHWMEHVDTVSRVVAVPIQVDRGRAMVPDAPGLGLEWNEDAVRAFLLA